MPEAASRFEVPGAALAWELSDEGGHPVVQLHGLTSSRARDRLLDLDLGRGLSGTRLLRYDARGHGRSSGRAVPEDYRWEVLADDLLRILDDRFPGEQVHGVGPSMGTGTLLHAAVREPERFSGLTLLVPPTAWETRRARGAEYRREAELLEAGAMGPGAVEMVETASIPVVGAAPAGAGTDDTAATVAPVPPATAGLPETLPDVAPGILPSLLRGAALSDLPSREAVAAIEVPTRILAWIDDPAHPVSTAEALHGLIGGSTLQVARTPADVQAWPGLLMADVPRR
ncbi:alpha/beta hydrolase [Agrococcus sp. SL85]|uniref:alpha/beta fold hydrolase n=1 Tax=Agrococcus sp. SL85 TaxID=2995141 RepID=UPI00226C883B|nr:alpha/beta hydrolase [Agrococcus sp. SL85]WAC65443.1 alpha/beta hydrolase [Agrococcus sp. SL85]